MLYIEDGLLPAHIPNENRRRAAECVSIGVWTEFQMRTARCHGVLQTKWTDHIPNERFSFALGEYRTVTAEIEALTACWWGRHVVRSLQSRAVSGVRLMTVETAE